MATLEFQAVGFLLAHGFNNIKLEDHPFVLAVAALFFGMWSAGCGIYGLCAKSTSKGAAITALVFGVVLATGAVAWAYQIGGPAFAFLEAPAWAAVISVVPFSGFIAWTAMFVAIETISQLPARIRNFSTFGLRGVFFLGGSVHIDDEGMTHYDGETGVVGRLEWNQVQEVAVVGEECGQAIIPFAILTSNSIELRMRPECKGFPALLDRLTALPHFPRDEFSRALDQADPYDEKVVVWRAKESHVGAAG
jgi:hypothetical protein